MISDLKPYPIMKKTGLPWLDTAPEHWELLPNRVLMRQRKLLVGDRHAGYQLLSLTKQGVIVRDVTEGKGKFSADMGTSQEVRTGDLIFCLFDVPETPRTVGLSPHDGMITGAYTVFECRDPLLAAFLDLFYRSLDDRKLLSPLYSGLRNTIPAPRLLSAKTPVPPPTEQAAIVRFLDFSNRRIGRMIRAKQKLVTLLNEQKQAVVHRAVTHGLNANVRLKPSGVEWLGDIPEHWDVVPTRWLFRSVTRRDLVGGEPKMSMSRHRGLVRSETLGTRSALSAQSVSFSVCHPDDLVMNKYQAHAGLFGCATERGLITANYSVFAPGPRAVTAYYALLYASPSYRAAFHLASKGVGDGMMPLYSSAFYRTPSVVPPRGEQQAIVVFVNEVVEKTTRAIETAEREIALLREYRATLTSDVVTGKFDVRDAAAQLPDEPVQPGSFDDLESVPVNEDSEVPSFDPNLDPVEA